MTTLTVVWQAILIGVVLTAAVPMVAGAVQVALAAWHGVRNHYRRAAPYFPRTAVIIPAWNEAAVLGPAIDRLMGLEYPPDALRVFVVDDASTDATPQVVAERARRYDGRVVHLRREHGGQGKAHTLNHGLDVVLADDWAEAVLIMDADVIYPPASLRRMTRHLADPAVGAVTAYITEGSRPGNYLTRFIGYEYVTAQATARRGQNVLGALACLAGGAQLHRREALEAIGGRVDTSSLAEDTVTTLTVQLHGYRALFEPHAVVLAEEPASVRALWQQRLRWARGNLQVTVRFRHLWFRHALRPGGPRGGPGLGGFWFGLLWFSLLLQPLFLILAAASLLTLAATHATLAAHVFAALWITNAVTFVFTTALSLLTDPTTARRVWPQAVLFPGVVSLAIMASQVYPPLFDAVAGQRHLIVLLTYVWLAASMGLAWLTKVVEAWPGGRVLAMLLIYLVGFGPLLCAITFTAYGKQARGAATTWDKTEKVGRVGL